MIYTNDKEGCTNDLRDLPFKKLQKLMVTRIEGREKRRKIKIKMFFFKRHSKSLLERRDRILLRLKELTLKQRNLGTVVDRQ